MLEEIMSKNNTVDLIDLGLIRISGKDAKPFLQGQLTCDLEEISTEQSRLGAHCDIKGRIIASFFTKMTIIFCYRAVRCHFY
jgi:folate-binding Fe-S cluster repair protein YgfZ